MIRIPNLTMELDAEEVTRGGAWHAAGPLVAAVARALAVPASQVARVQVLRRSIDARKRSHVHFNVTALAQLASPAAEAAAAASSLSLYSASISCTVKLLPQ